MLLTTTYMEKAVISVYRYQELEGSFKENAKNEFYNSMDDSSWDEEVKSRFTERMAKMGFTVDMIYYNIGSGQGDGAMFEGSVSDWSKLLPKLSERVQKNIEACIKAEPKFLSMLSWKVEHDRGRYYHENSGSTECYIDIDENDSIFHDIDSKWDVEDDIDEDVTILVYQPECQAFYKELCDEYDKETNEDAIESYYNDEDAWFTSFGERVYPIEVFVD